MVTADSVRRYGVKFEKKKEIKPMKSQTFYKRDFLKHRTVEDVRAYVKGELNELATRFATYFYGNGEVIVYPVNSEESFSFFVDTYGAQSYLVGEL